MKQRGRRRQAISALLGTKRTAIVLYAMLVVLPAVVFGGLLWHQLATDHSAQLEAVPEDVQDAASRTLNGIERRFRQLVREEEARPWFQYQTEYYRPGTTSDVPIIRSPLVDERRPAGILGWYQYDRNDGRDAVPEVFLGSDWIDEGPLLDLSLRLHLSGVFKEKQHGNLEHMRLGDWEPSNIPLKLAAVNYSKDRDPDCLRKDLIAISEFDGETIKQTVWDFHFRMQRDSTGEMRIFGTRRIELRAPLHLAAALPDCFESIGYPVSIAQGFYVDPDWLFRDMPREVAAEVLTGSQHFLLPDHGEQEISERDSVAEIRLFDELAFELAADDENDPILRPMKIAADTGQMERRFRTQFGWLVGVAGMMAISLVIGIRLLILSIAASLEEARRTGNFVAAVTHELRTPIASVKLYGEMLQAGWVTDEDKRADYIDRIVRETDRLDTLVDRVLEKSRLGSTTPKALPGDLNESVEEQIPGLKLTAGTFGEDVAFDLAPDLPKVKLIEESVHAILVNLVENARKYAPVDVAQGHDPILVRTRKSRSEILLEVCDRGPGIPADERSRIFDAFYRIGDERTRTARGTGLGLHIVFLQAQAMGASVEVFEREGGGSVFQIRFRTA